MPHAASPELQADAFADLLDVLGEDRAFVLGGSAGALSAIQFAIRHPDRCRGLVLLVPASYSPTRPASDTALASPLARTAALSALKSDFLFWAALRLAPGPTTKTLLATDPSLLESASADERSRVKAIRDHILPVSRRQAGIIDDRLAGSPPAYPLAQIKCPVLTIAAHDDLFGTYAAADYAARAVPDGRMLAFPSGGHLLVGRDAEVWREVDQFLQSLTATPEASVRRPAGRRAEYESDDRELRWVT
jgi:pimeloyl-ACP methyl ester carboxylesterase